VGVIPPGKRVELGIMRNRKQQAIDFKIGERPTDATLARQSLVPELKEPVQPKANPKVWGMEIAALDDVSRESLGLTEGGVLVEKVTGDPARQAGVVNGDVISMVDGQKVNSPKQLQRLVNDLPKGKTIALLVHRGGSARFLALSLE